MNGFSLDDYDFHLPSDRVAQRGAEPRDSSRLMIVPRFMRDGRGGNLAHRVFRDLPDFLRAGDVLVLNRTRVIPARLEARKASGGRLEVLLLRELAALEWTAYLKPARRVAVGGRLEFGPVSAVVTGVLDDGARVLRFDADVKPHLDALGALPLPPYIHASDVGERYQTVYAADPGSVAAPTAGLHFTPELLDRVRAMGVDVRFLTLHVGAGTFKPVASSIDAHVMHEEIFDVPAGTASAVTAARREGRRVVAVGTTVVRTLEAAWRDADGLTAGPGETSIFIRPPYAFRAVDALVTNFHLPRSTLLMLVAAFAGFETMRAAYAAALDGEYRFYSLGDAMFLA